jgi:hypothetical protein
MNAYIVFVEDEGYLLDPDDETFTEVPAQAYPFYHRDEAESEAEMWYGAEVIPVQREDVWDV